ncbi:hypothetical protein B0H11DRAFT_2206470 [Mycena galericulata]|nr:hypothetical protein B0H11DRAFT_2206470 [Mycena galericulata]
MRSLQLWWILWVVSFGFFAQMPSPSSSSAPSSLAHRNERRIRQARIHANLAPYRSPPRLYVGLPLHNVANAPSARPVGDLESHRAAHRGADREQLALQDTPSRRRRRIPANRAGDENRAPSPTPAVCRYIAQPVFAGVGTPPDSQRPSLPPNKRSLGQQRRQEREHQAAAAAQVSQPEQLHAPENRREAGQRRRRERERREREDRERHAQENQQQLRVEREQHEQAGQGRNHDNQLLTPPATHRREQAIAQNLEMVTSGLNPLLLLALAVAVVNVLSPQLAGPT